MSARNWFSHPSSTTIFARLRQATAGVIQFEQLEPRQLMSGYLISDVGAGKANGLNNFGEVVGVTDTGDPFYWSASTGQINMDPTELGSGSASAINDAGTVVGWTDDTGKKSHAFRTDINDHTTVGGSDYTYGDAATDPASEFTAIDNSFIGLTVGSNVNNSPADGVFYNGQTFNSVGSEALPSGISDYDNSTGITGIVGTEGVIASQSTIPYYSTDPSSSLTNIEPLLDTETGAYGVAQGISPNGDAVVGYSTTSDPTIASGIAAFVYYPLSGTASFVPESDATNVEPISADAINNFGQLVGSAETSNGLAAYVDDPSDFNNAPLDLNTLLPVGSGWQLQEATGINSSGQICGFGTFEGNPEAFLLTPQDAPPTVSNVSVADVTTAGSQSDVLSVTYSSPFGFNIASLNPDDISVSGPSGKNVGVSLQSITPSADQTEVTVNYNLQGPGGSWDASDDGNYTVSLNSATVQDAVGNFASPQTLASFNTNIPGASISGTIFNDANGNGKRDSNEGVIASGAELYLDANNNGVLDTGEVALYAGPSGTYGFTNLAPGTYHLRLKATSNEAVSAPSSGVYTITLSAGQAVTNENFGFKPVVNIGGTVFNDANRNGVINTGEKDLTGVELYLDTNKNGKLDNGEPTIKTDSNGNYKFTALNPGSYIVREVLPAGYKLIAPTVGYISVNLAKGTNATAENFADAQLLGSVSGEVFTDLNSNGKLDSGEKGIAGVKVYLDANKNGKLDSGELTATTSSTGTYSIAAAPGTYQVREVLPAGDKVVSPSSGYTTITIADQSKLTGVNFADAPLPATISGEVFNDANANQKVDKGETGLAGWRVYLDKNGDGKYETGETTALTNSKGSYSFGSLAAGTYYLRLVAPTGYTPTTPAGGVYKLLLIAGQNSTGHLFGEKKITISVTGGSDLLQLSATDENFKNLFSPKSVKSTTIPYNNSVTASVEDDLGSTHTFLSKATVSDAFNAGKFVITASGDAEEHGGFEGIDNADYSMDVLFQVTATMTYSITLSTGFEGSQATETEAGFYGPDNKPIIDITSGVEKGPGSTVTKTGTLTPGLYQIFSDAQVGGGGGDEVGDFSVSFSAI